MFAESQRNHQINASTKTLFRKTQRSPQWFASKTDKARANDAISFGLKTSQDARDNLGSCRIFQHNRRPLPASQNIEVRTRNWKD